jgi:hypothetical protein
MTAIENTPTNKNFLSPLNFKFSIKKAPHVNFFIQQVNIASINISQYDMPTPMVKIPIPGEHIAYGDLRVTFKVDEDLTNYLEIHDWLRGMGKPASFLEHKNLNSKPLATGEGIYSDVSVIVMNSAKMSNYEVVYRDAFPVSLSELIFDTTKTDVDYLEATATFKYILFDVNHV